MSLEENMEDILNIDAEVVESKPSKPTPPKVDKDDRTKDYEYTRGELYSCLLYTSPSPRDKRQSRMPSSA